jgi:hypothetical protein
MMKLNHSHLWKVKSHYLPSSLRDKQRLIVFAASWLLIWVKLWFLNRSINSKIKKNMTAQHSNPLTSLPYLMDLHRRLNKRLRIVRIVEPQEEKRVLRKIDLTEMMMDAYLPEDEDQLLKQ